MSFTPRQTEALNKPLARSNVKTRRQAGRDLSYVESWHAEAEANRIFGFDGWSSTLLDLRMVAERDVTIGQRQGSVGYPGYSVSYVCSVRVEAGGVTRDGVGAGHGIDRDLGLAHESAVKEAASDAEKRALKTFGNIFGLALYDKTQEHVEDAHEPPRASAPRPLDDARGAGSPSERAAISPASRRGTGAGTSVTGAATSAKANGATRRKPQMTLPQRTDLFLKALHECKSQEGLSQTYESAQVLRDLLDKSDPEALEGVNVIYRDLWERLPAKERA